jgi:hypothetical protein
MGKSATTHAKRNSINHDEVGGLSKLQTSFLSDSLEGIIEQNWHSHELPVFAHQVNIYPQAHDKCTGKSSNEQWVLINPIFLATPLNLLDNSKMKTVTLTLRLPFSCLTQAKDRDAERPTVFRFHSLPGIHS